MSATHQFDALTVLRDIDDGAETATADETGILFPVRFSGLFEVVINITAIDAASGNETYVLVVDVDSLAAFSDAPVEVARKTVDKATAMPAEVRIPLASDDIARLDSNAAAIRVGLEAGGTTPSITYGAWIAPAAAGARAKAAEYA